jgi:hypothetical protein
MIASPNHISGFHFDIAYDPLRLRDEIASIETVCAKASDCATAELPQVSLSRLGSAARDPAHRNVPDQTQNFV